MSFKIQQSILKGDHRSRFIEQLIFHYLCTSQRIKIVSVINGK